MSTRPNSNGSGAAVTATGVTMGVASGKFALEWALSEGDRWASPIALWSRVILEAAHIAVSHMSALGD